jgi:O-antigen ligase
MKVMSKGFDEVTEKGILAFIFFLPIFSPLSVLGALVALIFFFIRWREKLNFRPILFWVTMFVLLFFTFLSAAFSIQKNVSFGRFPFYILSFLLCFMMAKSSISPNKILKVFIMSGIIVTAFGIIQYLTGFNLKIKTDLFSMTFATKKGITSTLSHPNRFAQYLVLGLPLATVSFSILKELKWKIGALCFILFSFVCLLLTKSFAGICAVLILILLAVFIKNWKIGVVLALLLSLIYITNEERLGKFVQRFTSLSSMETRFSTWKVTFSAVKRHPLTGCGLSTFQKIAREYKGDEKIMHGHAHSMYVQLLCETGILGFSVFVFLMIAFLRYSFQRGSPISYGCAFSIIGTLLAGLTGTILEFLPLAMLFWTIIGIGIGENNDKERFTPLVIVPNK